ncbi:MAG TPA: helix-turn-helix transcriptional regulator [Butyricimonas virosa]|uniref:Helix-turn-helix transcriptional regulator n=1 Tax=Butyricimonas virosa TaxID=544645 RepID=A0A921H3Y2_9BACT|nr:helix-turn-helix transcriptional regulator [Butyricimonas virosa]
MSERTPIEQYVINRVREKRKQKGWTQAEFASEAGYSYGFIGNVETANGDKKYNLNNLYRFAKVFGCSIREFFPEELSEIDQLMANK